MKTQLFIEGYEIELNEDVQFCLNKQYEELQNPTTIIVDWSKTVEIPFTALNNKTFGYIYKPNRIINSGSGMGVYFDPTKKLNFKLVYNTLTLMTGYAKMNEVKQTNNKSTYNITLFGLLGKVLQEMSKITFNKSAADSTYIIDGSKYINTKLNRTLVYDSWTSTGQQQLTLYPIKLLTQGGEVNHPAYHITDIIGFLPNNSFDNGFDYKSYQTPTYKINTFADTLSSEGFTDVTGISPDDVIPNGLLPREIAEYRSYLQIPFIYWNKFFLMFNEKVTEITGYDIELDNNWFNSTNPYYYNLVMIGSRPYDNQSNDQYGNSYMFQFVEGSIYWGSDWNTNKNAYIGIASSAPYNQESYPLLSGDIFTVTTNEKVTLGPINLRVLVPANYISQDRKAITWKTDKFLQIRRDIINADTNAILDTTYVYYGPGLTENYNHFKVEETSYELNAYYNAWNFTLPSQTITKHNTDAEHLKIKFTAQFNAPVGDSPWLSDGSTYNPGSSAISSLLFNNTESNMNGVTISFPYESDSTITFNDLWNNEYSPFNEIIKYCKMFRVSISVDDINKKIKYERLSSYFNNYNILDWTDKIDFSKDFIVKPITFENKYIQFNYQDSDLKSLENYKKKYGYNYGEKVINTNYNFNTETKKLFEKEKIMTSICNSDNVLSWKSLFNQKQIAYTNCGEVFVLCKDKDNKYKKQFGNYFFHNGLANFSTSEPMFKPIISDDTDYMLDNSVKCYALTFNSTSVSTYPSLYPYYVSNNVKRSCLFGNPMTSYSSTLIYTDAQSIYDTFWETYLNERYNVQNKLITCYIKLTPSDFINFKFSNFIKIDNVIYFVNKIYDYNIESNGVTKVNLITVQDISAYTS